MIKKKSTIVVSVSQSFRASLSLLQLERAVDVEALMKKRNNYSSLIFTECLLCARHCAKCFINSSGLILTSTTTQ